MKFYGSSYRFSPITSERELLATIQYLNEACYQLCQKVIGRFYPVGGNVGVFCHYDDEYKFLTGLRERLTQEDENFQRKYYKLLEPVQIGESREAPSAVYDYLYIRKPDPYRAQVGDVDFVVSGDKYMELERSIKIGAVQDARIFERPEANIIELFNQNFDVLSYITTEPMAAKIKRQ